MNQQGRRRYAVQVTVEDRPVAGFAELAALALGLLIVLFWSYWPPLVGLFKDWRAEEDYSAGQLVPLVAAFLVWRDWKVLKQCSLSPCWWGMSLILLAAAGGLYGLLFMFESAQRYSVVLATAGLVLTVAGRAAFRRVFWILLFLFLMVPLPGKVHNLIGGPLQQWATSGSIFLLEAFVRVSRQGNVVVLNGTTPLAVAEACSGLRMLTAFIVVAGFIAHVVRRPRWQKTIVLASSIPVGVACNVVRIFLTAMLMLYVSEDIAQKFFHDFAGLVMMPVAVSLIFSELWLIDKLILSETDLQPDAVVVKAGSRRRRP